MSSVINEFGKPQARLELVERTLRSSRKEHPQFSRINQILKSQENAVRRRRQSPYSRPARRDSEDEFSDALHEHVIPAVAVEVLPVSLDVETPPALEIPELPLLPHRDLA